MNKRLLILIFSVLAIGFTAFLSFNWRSGGPVERISIYGNYTISGEEILKIARLDGPAQDMSEIKIDNIQDRIANHPEVKKVFVSKENPSELKIEIIERRPVAILNGENELRLIDDELESFQFRNAAKMYDLPVISGVRMENKPGDMRRYNEGDLRLAVFLIQHLYKENKTAYSNVSEINLSDTSRTVIFLSEDSSPIYFTRKFNESISNEAYRNELLKELTIFENYIPQHIDKHLRAQINYVDMRFDNQVIINYKN